VDRVCRIGLVESPDSIALLWREAVQVWIFIIITHYNAPPNTENTGMESDLIFKLFVFLSLLSDKNSLVFRPPVPLFINPYKQILLRSNHETFIYLEGLYCLISAIWGIAGTAVFFMTPLRD
jgi:hypothetical protein